MRIAYSAFAIDTLAPSVKVTITPPEIIVALSFAEIETFQIDASPAKGLFATFEIE